MTTPRLILSLCDFSGHWCQAYRDDGRYEVIQVDIKHGHDVRDFVPSRLPWGVLAAPPCTVWTNAGARYWKMRTPSEIAEAWGITQACRRLCALALSWWCLENPRGRLSRFIGPPAMEFQPWHYGDPYTKRTCLWGRFTPPATARVIPTARMVACSDAGRGERETLFGSEKMTELRPNPYASGCSMAERQAAASMTPKGFSRAFYEANP